MNRFRSVLSAALQRGRVAAPQLVLDVGADTTRLHAIGAATVTRSSSFLKKQDETGVIVLDINRKQAFQAKEFVLVQPFYQGRIDVLEDFELFLQLLFRHQEYSGSHFGLVRPNVKAAFSQELSTVQKQAFTTALKQQGIGEVELEDPCLALYRYLQKKNAHIPGVFGSIIIGAASTHVAIFVEGVLLEHAHFSIGSREMTLSILETLESQEQCQIGFQVAEKLKLELAQAPVAAKDDDTFLVVRGKDTRSGLPVTKKMSSKDISLPIADTLVQLQEAITSVMERLNSNSMARLSESGFVLAGGGSKLRHLSEYLSEQLLVPCRKIPQPESVVWRGLEAEYV